MSRFTMEVESEAMKQVISFVRTALDSGYFDDRDGSGYTSDEVAVIERTLADVESEIMEREGEEASRNGETIG